MARGEERKGGGHDGWAQAGLGNEWEGWGWVFLEQVGQDVGMGVGLGLVVGLALEVGLELELDLGLGLGIGLGLIARLDLRARFDLRLEQGWSLGGGKGMGWVLAWQEGCGGRSREDRVGDV